MSVEKVLVSVIAALFQSVAVTTICLKQQNINTKSEIIKFFIPMFLYCMASFYFIPNQLRFILFIITISLVLYFILKKEDKIVILYAFNTEVMMATSEILISLLLVLFGVNSVDIVNNYKYNLLANVLISVLAILLIQIDFIKKLLIRIIYYFEKQRKKLNYLMLFLIILYLLVSKNGLEFVLKSNYYVNIIFVITFLIIFNIVIKNESKYEQLKEKNKQMLNYVTKYEKNYYCSR